MDCSPPGSSVLGIFQAELASRDHVKRLVPLVRAALDEAGLTPSDIDGVSPGPGLWLEQAGGGRAPS